MSELPIINKSYEKDVQGHLEITLPDNMYYTCILKQKYLDLKAEFRA